VHHWPNFALVLIPARKEKSVQRIAAFNGTAAVLPKLSRVSISAERKGKERKGKERKGKERKDCSFRHQFNEKPPGCSGVSHTYHTTEQSCFAEVCKTWLSFV